MIITDEETRLLYLARCSAPTIRPSHVMATRLVTSADLPRLSFSIRPFVQ